MIYLTLFIIFVVIYLLFKSIVIVNQYERGIVLTLGTYSYTLNPGLKIVVPILQRVIKVDIRINTIDIPQQVLRNKKIQRQLRKLKTSTTRIWN